MTSSQGVVVQVGRDPGRGVLVRPVTLTRQVAAEHREALHDVGVDGTATFILGGQVGTEDADILLVYPEGNYIRASEERPFLQIGESKYGKFMLELAVKANVDIDTATSIALGSMMSTAGANLSVGPPYDGCVYLKDSRKPIEFRLQSDSRSWRSCEKPGSVK